MTNDLAEKVYSLQKNVLELHNLFDLNMVANQSRSVEDLLSKVAFLIKSSLSLRTIRFFLNNNGVFQTKNIASDSDLEFEFTVDNAPFLQRETEKLIKITNQDGTLIYSAFWNTYRLNELESEYIKAFYNEEIPFCLCSISKKEFLSKMYIAYKECAETQYWLDLLNSTDYLSDKEYISISEDCKEIKRILASITKSLKDSFDVES